MKVLDKLTLSIGAEPYPGYRLTDFLGSGGWGEVWRSTTPHGGAAALKFLPTVSQRTATQEIRALQSILQLEHPNLVRMHHIWSCPGYLVVVMELADGNLLDLLSVYRAELNAPLLPEHLCDFLQQAAAAIDFLNERRHVVDGERVAFRHCDVKPSNLLVVGSVVKLADFSLAVPATAAAAPCRRAGTIAYAAPEVFQGWLSDRTDQFCLAMTYYHLRTGAVPFARSSASFDRKYRRAPVDLSAFSGNERDILARAFDPMPAQRWPSCTEFMSRLSRCFKPAYVAG